MPSLIANVTINSDVEIDFEIFCANCGAGLCNQTALRENKHQKCPQIEVSPCKHCISVAVSSAIENCRHSDD